MEKAFFVGKYVNAASFEIFGFTEESLKKVQDDLEKKLIKEHWDKVYFDCTNFIRTYLDDDKEVENAIEAITKKWEWIKLNELNYYIRRRSLINRLTNKLPPTPARLLMRAKARETRLKIRKLCISHYSKGKLECACCGENRLELLQIDHINGDGWTHRKEIGNQIYPWIIKNNYPNGLQVLCKGCNFTKGTLSKCPCRWGTGGGSSENKMASQNLESPPSFLEVNSCRIDPQSKVSLPTSNL